MVRCRKGFSLSEVFTVVMIIATLLGILLPALSRLLIHARATSCSNNLHQIGLAVRQIKQEESDGAAAQLRSTGWTNQLAPYLNLNSNVLVCPEEESPTRTVTTERVVVRIYPAGSKRGAYYDAPLEADESSFKLSQEQYESFKSDVKAGRRGTKLEEKYGTYEPGSNPDVWYIAMEDVRPSHGGMDYNDIVVRIEHKGDEIEAQAWKGSAGYYHEVVCEDGRVIVSPLSRAPKTFMLAIAAASSYGMSREIDRLGLGSLGATSGSAQDKILALDYARPVASPEDNWGEFKVVLDNATIYNFARHADQVNVLRLDGSVGSYDPRTIDPGPCDESPEALEAASQIRQNMWMLED
jgi:prepilin-type processing-associated H-X9-DG protein